MSSPRRAFFRVLRKGAKVVAWAFALWVIVVGLQACADGRLLFRPKPPLEQLPQGPPKFVPTR